MDKRTRERLALHKPHGLQNTGKTTELQPGKELHICPCGWSGWLDIGDNND